MTGRYSMPSLRRSDCTCSVSSLPCVPLSIELVPLGTSAQCHRYSKIHHGVTKRHGCESVVPRHRLLRRHSGHLVINGGAHGVADSEAEASSVSAVTPTDCSGTNFHQVHTATIQSPVSRRTS